MTDYEHCPVCHKELPEKLEANFCPFCGVKFDPNAQEPPELNPPVPLSMEEEKPEPDEQESTEPAGIPWENRGDLSLLQRLTQTWSESMFNPSEFFASMKSGSGIGLALLYGLVFKIIGSIFSVYWQSNALQNLESNMQEMPAAWREAFRMVLENPIIASPETQLFIAPFIGIFLLFFNSMLFHVAMMITGAAKNGYETTFRVVAYAESSAIFYAIPMVGGTIAVVYWLVLIIIGNREAHRAPGGQVIAAVLLPLFLCLCLFSISLFTFASALIGPSN
ncbi:MAG: YIP1 family protein [Deferribacteres bacterium]|nr:YIP1 family protein [candidate division KSB1 bacterium]MCB9509597.1 YIP1 family protein [Deferribacteres bacterium]